MENKKVTLDVYTPDNIVFKDVFNCGIGCYLTELKFIPLEGIKYDDEKAKELLNILKNRKLKLTIEIGGDYNGTEKNV